MIFFYQVAGAMFKSSLILPYTLKLSQSFPQIPLINYTLVSDQYSLLAELFEPCPLFKCLSAIDRHLGRVIYLQQNSIYFVLYFIRTSADKTKLKYYYYG